MILRTFSGGALALAVLLCGPAHALSSVGEAHVAEPAAERPGTVGHSGFDSAAYEVAQAGDPRITQLEELVRQLNGRVEELNFQILQMQEQLRKQSEDVEFRFQQLEEKRGDAGSTEAGKTIASAPATDDVQAAPAPGGLPAEGTVAPDAPGAPKTLGSITFDQNGLPAGGSILAPGVDAGGDTVAALPSASDPEELYRNSYELILSGDYGAAEAGFRDHIERFPDDQRSADARFWLGESLLGQEKYRDAAEVFLAANKSHPKSRKSPDMLLKLGISLSALNQRDVACATYGEIGRRYPNASGALKERVKQEQSLAGC